ncbi:hypothetical protein B0H10DRAFT_2233249 [Mycena sp. CBHHK59/15]|nr:hypothetical protein B0H10DRAFT_2233249 [Mycena sp. CBHHK59/15]
MCAKRYEHTQPFTSTASCPDGPKWEYVPNSSPPCPKNILVQLNSAQFMEVNKFNS